MLLKRISLMLLNVTPQILRKTGWIVSLTWTHLKSAPKAVAAIGFESQHTLQGMAPPDEDTESRRPVPGKQILLIHLETLLECPFLPSIFLAPYTC